MYVYPWKTKGNSGDCVVYGYLWKIVSGYRGLCFAWIILENTGALKGVVGELCFVVISSENKGDYRGDWVLY